MIDGLAYGAMPRRLIEGARSNGRRVIALVHHPLCLEAGLTAEAARRLEASEREALGLADAVVVSSGATARTLASDFGVPATRITVAEPGTVRAGRAARVGGPPCLLAVGSVVPRKAYTVLVEALAGLAQRPWRLTIVGAARDAAELARVRASIERARLGERILMLGEVEEAAMPGHYTAADIFVMPSLYEGYGMALAEAMAHGLPIICTTGGAAAETCPDGAAIKVAPGDPLAFRTALDEVLSSRAVADALADASFSAGRALPTWEDTVARVASVIRRVAP
jgi:glycosyltransferase involved in cell wall biosynthesis